MSDDTEPLRARKRKEPDSSDKAEASASASVSDEPAKKDKDQVSVEVDNSNKRSLNKLETDDEAHPISMGPGWACLFGWILGPIGILIIFFIARKHIQLSVMGFIIEIVMIAIACEIAFLLVHT